MPSEQQLQKAEQERRDLEKELQLLNDATDPQESATRIMDYIANSKEGLVDRESRVQFTTALKYELIGIQLAADVFFRSGHTRTSSLRHWPKRRQRHIISNMPSEQQLQKAEQERRDLEKELQLLNDATDPQESATRIMDYISNSKEGLVDAENNPWLGDPPCCQIL